MIFYAVLIVTLAQGSLGTEVCASDQSGNVEKAFRTVNLAPDIYTTAPQYLLVVDYNGANANLGNRISEKTTKREPTVLCPQARHDTLYTLVTLDADANDGLGGKVGSILCKNKNLPALLWLVNNISGDKVTDAKATVECKGPWESGHRIVFYYFAQSSGIDVGHSELKGLDRNCFDLKDYASVNNLHLLAGNYFISA